MTLATTQSRATYAGAGLAGPFAVPFRFFAGSDLKVTKRVAGVETPLTYALDFTATGQGDATGNVTLTNVLNAGEVLVIRRGAMSLTQGVSIRNKGSYFASTHEDVFDRLAMLDQQQQDLIDRCLKLAETLDPTGYNLTLPNPDAGKVMVGTGSGFTMSTLDSSAVALPGESRTVATLSAYLQNNRIWNPKDYGAIGDGNSHPLSAFFGTLAAAQAVYPHAVSLTDEIDWAAIQAAENAAHAVGGIHRLPAPSVRYRMNRSWTRYANVSVIGDGKESVQLNYPSATNGIDLIAPAFGTIVGRMSGFTVAGTYGTSLVGLNLKNCLFLTIDNVEITGFTNGNIVCLDFGQITLRDVFVGGGGDATHANVLFDTTVAVAGSCNGIYGFNFTISGGGAASVAGLRIERTINAQFFAGALESAGVLAQISATNDGTDGKYCANIAFYGTDFENPTGKYIEAGTAWNIGLGTIALKQFSLFGVGGTLSGSTTAAFGVVLRLTQGFTSWGSNFILGSVGTAMYDLVSNVTGVLIGPCPNASLAGGVYIRSGGTSVAASIQDTYTAAGWKMAADVDAGGGYRQSIDGWYQNAAAANQNNVVLTRLATATEVPARWIAPRPGSITAVWVKSDAARTAGTLTVFVFKNNASVGFSAVLDGTNPTFKVTTALKDALAFVAGDEIDLRVATDAGWLPVTANIRAGLEVET